MGPEGAVWGKPRSLAIDGGSEFKGHFRKAAKRIRAKVRLGSPSKTAITGLIERFWRTLDELIGAPLNLPVTLSDIESRLARAVAYYTCFRPILALGGATPAERLNGVEPQAGRAVQPPRARPGIDRGPPPMLLGWLDPVSRQLPYFQPA